MNAQLETNTLMVCTACGAEAKASCACGVGYMPKAVRAAEAIKANPEKSDRAIAEELGVSDMTVGRARKQVQHDVAPEKRVGLDGKKQAAKKKRPENESSRQAKPAPKTEKVQPAVDALVRAGASVPRDKLAAEYGVSQKTVQLADMKARGKVEAEARRFAPRTCRRPRRRNLKRQSASTGDSLKASLRSARAPRRMN